MLTALHWLLIPGSVGQFQLYLTSSGNQSDRKLLRCHANRQLGGDEGLKSELPGKTRLQTQLSSTLGDETIDMQVTTKT